MVISRHLSLPDAINYMTRRRASTDDHFNAGMRLLESLVQHPTSKGVSQLADDLGLAVSSTHDMLKILCELGFVVKNPDTRKYSPSPRMFEFIHFFSTNFGINPKVSEIINLRASELGLSIFLGTIWDNASYVISASGPLAGVSAIGSHGPVSFTAIGKAIIADEPKENWGKYADLLENASLPNQAKRPDRSEFLRELEQISHSKVAWNIFGTENNIFSVATKVKADYHNRRYAVALVFSKQMYAFIDRQKMEETVLETASAVGDAIEVEHLARHND